MFQLFLHDIDYDKFNIACEDTLKNPAHWDDEGTLYLALTPSQLALLEILRNSDVFDAEVNITLLADIDWQMP